MKVLKSIRGEGRNIYDWLWVLNKERIEYTKQAAPRCKNLKEKHPLSIVHKKEIDEFFLTYYGKKIPYDWHQFYMAHNGVFTPDYFPELLYFPHFEHYMNYKKDYGMVLEDKNFLSNIAKAAKVHMPKTVLSCTTNLLQNADGEVVSIDDARRILRDYEKVFCKPTTTSYGGKGCFIYDLTAQNGTMSDFIRSLGSDFVIQELVKCHDSIATL